VITSAACFYDVDDPERFVEDIRKSLASDGVWINQLNDAPTMLKRHAFDSICHEHLCYYDVPALRALYQRHGLRIVDLAFNEVNGGSVRTVAVHERSSEPSTDLLGAPAVSRADCETFARWVGRWRKTMRAVLDGL